MFDEQKAEQITERISQGIPVSQVARELNIGRRTIHDWREANPTFAAQFARAKDDGFDAISDEVIEIADDADPKQVDHARLRCDARLKLLAKWDSKRYGDRITQDVDLTVRVAIADPTRQLRNAATTQPALAGEARTAPALEHSGPVSALAVGALVQPNRGEEP